MAGIVDSIKKEVIHADRTKDKGIVNEKTGSSMLIRENGDVSLASNTTAQYKLGHDNGSATEISHQSTTITNRKTLTTDEVVINNHKLNPRIYEWTDMKVLNDTYAIGNFTMFGTVLVKAWEPNLGRYVLIRRLVRMPMFSPNLNLPDAPNKMSVDSDINDALNKLKEK
jgi:hypothetical protein